MNKFSSRNLKTNKQIHQLKNKQTAIFSSNQNQGLIFNNTMLSKFNSSIKKPREEDNFQDRHIFAQRSHLKTLSSANKSNQKIQKRREAFFIPICPVRDIKSPLKADIIKVAYNTPLNKIKSQRSQFSVNYQNINFNLPRRKNCIIGNNKKLIKNSLMELILRKVSSKKQIRQQKNRPRTSISRQCVTQKRYQQRRDSSMCIRRITTQSPTINKRSLQDERVQNSLMSLSKDEIKLPIKKQTFILSPWQYNQ